MVQFSKGTAKRVKLGIADILQVPTLNSIGTYLDYKNIGCKRIREGFVIFKDKISSKLPGWKARALSQAGKSILAKSNSRYFYVFYARH